MRTALLIASLMFSPLALAQDAPAEDGTAAEGEAPAEGGEADKETIPEFEPQVLIDACGAVGLMEECTVEDWVGLCKLEPCDRGWKDGARACKQCILNRKAAPVEEAAPEEAPEEADEADEGGEGEKGKGKRRVKKRDCGCDASAAPVSALALGLIVPVVARRRRS